MAKTKITEVNYTELSQELAEVMARLEQGDLGVDAAVACYQRGLQIVSRLEAHLKQAENQVSQLKAFHDSASTDEEE